VIHTQSRESDSSAEALVVDRAIPVIDTVIRRRCRGWTRGRDVRDDLRILHLAAHGILDDRSPLYSAIVLAAVRDESDDRLLEAREILNLHLTSDLAVLASCDTGKGHIGAGEGVIGMSWAFLVAGCPTTVVSQWLADSRATEALMIEFYRRLRAGDAPAAALRHAQLTVRANPRYQDPLYWAPFIVVGAGMRELGR
jgi:CHAT domain-containing protein